MPKNVPPELEDKFRSCKEKVMADGQDEEAAYGICYMSVVEGKSLDDAMKAWAEDYIKRGNRNNRKDAERLQNIHDYAVENGATCGGKSFEMPEDMLINYGTAAKSLKSADVKDFAVVYDGQDLSADYFSRDTEYGFAGADTKRVPIMFNHAQPLELSGGKSYSERGVIGEAELQVTDEGVLIKEAILYNRKKYEAYLDDLGWSTGAASHAVVREQKGGRNHIKQWLLSELSITPMSAEPRLKNVIALKSITHEAVITDKGDETKNKKSIMEKNEMEKDEFKALLDENKVALTEVIKAEAKTAAADAVKAAIDALPEVKNGVATVTVTKDEADREFTSLAEQLTAVKNFEMSKGQMVDARLKRLDGTKAALGMNESVPSQGQFLLEPTISNEFFKPVHEQGVFSGKVKTLPVGANSNYGWINGVDETSRANGSRWGGVLGYWRAEASSITATKPKFRRVNWELHALEVLMYITDEALQDISMTASIAQQSAAEELNFKINDAILNGDGVGKPLGVLNSTALISATRTDANKIQHADILGMWQRVHPSFRNGLAWYVNSEAEPQLDALFFSTGSEGLLSPYIMYRPDGVMTIKGKPVIVTEFNPALGAVGDILLADMSQYLLWQKGGVTSSVNPWIQWLTSEQAYKFTARVDGQSAYASPITPYKGTNTQSAFVALAATT